MFWKKQYILQIKTLNLFALFFRRRNFVYLSYPLRILLRTSWGLYVMNSLHTVHKMNASCERCGVDAHVLYSKLL
jgi:hypothetical protein